MSAAELATTYIDELTAALRSIAPETIAHIAGILDRARQEGRKIFVFGNGGSAATASHVALDLNKTTVRSGAPRLRAIALTDSAPLITAWANDTDYRNVFVEQLRNFVEAGDVVIAISGSGRSPNVLEATRAAGEAGAVTIGLTGFEGGDLHQLVDVGLVVRSNVMGQVEDAHLAIGHILTALLSR